MHKTFARNEIIITYHGHVKNGKILLDEEAQLPEGAAVYIDVVPLTPSISLPKHREKLQAFQPVQMPGGSLAHELFKDRR